ncbi:MAG: ABC transporter ATP-binding protein [Pseudomonadota bacterium]
MPTAAIETVQLGKRYRRGHRVLYRTLRDDLVKGVQALVGRGAEPSTPDPWLWALQGLDLQVEQGEILGIIGSNGAGKSTLLKLLAGITEPTTGHADLEGRVGSLLEVGTGFHMELSGRENVFLSGAILGMRRAEILRSFDEIVAFAGVESFLDTPIKHYSSGMHMRLAFSVAAHLACEILLVDEVLAVGDAAFQRRCVGRMGEIAGQGRTVLFVSHNMAAVQALCSRAIRLEQGRLVDSGGSAEVITRYLQGIDRPDSGSLALRRDRQGEGGARLTAVSVESLDEDGLIRPTSGIRLRLDWQTDGPAEDLVFVASVYDIAGTGLFLLDSGTSEQVPARLAQRGQLTCTTAALRLTPGRCYINLRLRQREATLDYVAHAIEFDVVATDVDGSGRLPERSWVVGVLDHRWDVS